MRESFGKLNGYAKTGSIRHLTRIGVFAAYSQVIVTGARRYAVIGAIESAFVPAAAAVNTTPQMAAERLPQEWLPRPARPRKTHARPSRARCGAVLAQASPPPRPNLAEPAFFLPCEMSLCGRQAAPILLVA
jgi:hypothetical protein